MSVSREVWFCLHKAGKLLKWYYMYLPCCQAVRADHCLSESLMECLGRQLEFAPAWTTGLIRSGTSVLGSRSIRLYNITPSYTNSLAHTHVRSYTLWCNNTQTGTRIHNSVYKKFLCGTNFCAKEIS